MSRESRVESRAPTDRPSTLFVAPPRITKSGEEWILKQVRSCDADGYLIRNYDHLNFFADCRRVGDFSLNVANPLTADYFMARFGLERLTASYDLNIAQLEGLLRGAPPEWFEVTIHQHMPMFHMEHCVFCAFLSTGKDFRDCGRPCDRHDVRVRDRVGQEHPLKADAGCRNTVFNGIPQSSARLVPELVARGVPSGVVDRFEVVEIEIENREALAVFVRLGERIEEGGTKRDAVGQLRQVVGVGGFFASMRFLTAL